MQVIFIVARQENYYRGSLNPEQRGLWAVTKEESLGYSILLQLSIGFAGAVSFGYSYEVVSLWSLRCR